MDERVIKEHISPEEIADYYEGLLRAKPEAEGRLEAHLSDCEQCVEMAWRYQDVSEVWEEWMSWLHEESPLPQVVHALERVGQQSAHSRWKSRVDNWLGQWAGRAEGAVRVILEAPGQASRLVTEGVEALLREGAAWQFALAPAPIRTKGAIRVRGEKAAPPSATVALAPGRPRARVAVSGEIGEVEVRVDEWAPGQIPPLVLLIPTKEGGEPRVKELGRQPGVAYLIARFENVEPGDYIVAFEPQALAIAREIGDRAGEGRALGNLGNAYAALGEPRRAIGFYEQDLTIAREIGDVMGAAIASFNLAQLLAREGQRAEALRHAEYAAQVFAEVGHPQYVQQAQQLLAQLRGQRK